MIFLLQSPYFKENDPRSMIIVLVIIVVFIIVMSTINIARNGIGKTSSKKGTSPRRFSKFALRRAATALGLNRDQINLLEWAFRTEGITDPEITLTNPTLLDKTFKHAFRAIEKGAETETIAEEQKSLLFSIRNRVEAVRSNTGKITSSRKLPDNMPATLTSPKGETYPVKIISAKGEELLVESPRSAVGTPIRLSRGAKIQLSFYSKSSQGYRMESRVIATIDTPRGPALQLAHSEKIEALPNRRFKRKQTHISCFFSLVRIEQRQVGRKIEKKTLVDDRRSLGTILDISAGGCAIKSAAALPPGNYLKIEFDDDHDRSHAALGRVIRTNKTGGIGGIMHIQFVKLPRKTLNTINALVFEYDQD
ncbi:flagellar brake protein [Gracilinema caldarium]|uniref:Type IV pilus assembly PilZ n=1 Tax=Gracilinema caldarium (strain ATCC 51460 / DSM 7334 / H1) TaxID=744872 RepID=F8EZ38_GRAC1|nr:PilZ domain-containing protein [Gracilinema caldarium]AEJ19269.1 type IV pilus assembly PilZ [Gracilinema caldarium DSM 7334]